MLVLRFELTESLIVAHGQEHRVVTEASITARRPYERPVSAAIERLGLPVVRPGDRERANEVGSRRTVRLACLDLSPNLLHGARPIAIPLIVLGPSRREDSGPTVK